MALLLIVVATPSETADEPAVPPYPCHWFDYSLDPPGYHLDILCLLEDPTGPLPS